MGIKIQDKESDGDSHSCQNSASHPEVDTSSKEKIRIVDFNNFFSPSGGGIRTYHLNKIEYFSHRPDVDYSLLVPHSEDSIENVGRARLIRLKAPAVPGTDNYRLFVNPFKLERILRELGPDLVEVGGSYVDPFLIRYATRSIKTVVVGYWHANYPTAYFETFGNRLSPAMGKVLEKIGWRLARGTYGRYDATFVASECVAEGLRREGIDRLLMCPLGVDIEQFNPAKADPDVKRQLGAQGRPLVFFPHRFFREKGIKEVAEAIPEIARATGAVFLFCGDGPEHHLVKDLIDTRTDCHHLGFVKSLDDMARYYATSDLVYGLSAWETFGLSIVEAMASGVPLIGANRGAADEWISRSGCGMTVPHGDTQALIESSIEILTRPDLKSLGKRGRRFVTRYFSWEATFERMLNYDRKLINAYRQGASAMAEISQNLPSLWEDGPEPLESQGLTEGIKRRSVL